MLRTSRAGSPRPWCAPLVAVCALAACAAPSADVHLAPLVTRVSTAEGGSDTEVLAGMLYTSRPHPASRSTVHAVRPLVSRERLAPDRTRWLHLPPLGWSVYHGDRGTSVQIPLWSWQRFENRHGALQTSLLALPGIIWTSDTQGRSSGGWFPIWGRLDDYFTYDRIHWVLFPLYSSSRREGVKTTNVLFPFFLWKRGDGTRGFRVWPLYGHARVEGNYDRRYVLWPFYHRHHNDLRLRPELQEHKWMLFPLAGATRRGTYRSYAFLWPFFGYAEDPRGDFHAYDAPWPLVRIQSGGLDPLADERIRVWPFYSRFRAGSLRTWSVAWPLFQVRHETYPRTERSSLYVIPFWQSWRRRDTRGETLASWQKLWPLYQRETDAGWSKVAFPVVWPFWRLEFVERHYSWIYRLWSREVEGPVVRERSWGGLWRREADGTEDRRSLVGLWSRRRYRDGGREVRETSLLFGLLRWRTTGGEGTELMWPALPGPGWPALRSDEPLSQPGAHGR